MQAKVRRFFKDTDDLDDEIEAIEDSISILDDAKSDMKEVSSKYFSDWKDDIIDYMNKYKEKLQLEIENLEERKRDIK